jgi:hypothetical protein
MQAKKFRESAEEVELVEPAELAESGSCRSCSPFPCGSAWISVRQNAVRREEIY